MLAMGSPTSVRTSTSCNALLRELQQIWNDIGESEVDKDRMLLELERECLQVYRRKVDEAVNAKARLHQSVAAKEAELATLMATLGELNGHSPIGQACRPVVKGLGMQGSVKALGRGYEYIMGVVIFVPIAVLAWFPFVTEFQTKLLFNQAFSRGLQIQRILAGGKKQKQKYLSTSKILSAHNLICGEREREMHDCNVKFTQLYIDLLHFLLLHISYTGNEF